MKFGRQWANDRLGELRMLRDWVRIAPIGHHRTGEPGPEFRGSVDEPKSGASASRGPLVVSGWSAFGDQPALAVAVHVDGVLVGRAATGHPWREDVATALGDATLAGAGWHLIADLSEIPVSDTATLVVTAWVHPTVAPIELDRITLSVSDDEPTSRHTDARPTDRFTELEQAVARLDGVVTSQADALEGHTEWLKSLERWVSSCVKILSNFGAQPLDNASPTASAELDIVGTLMSRMEVPTVMSWIADAAEVEEGPVVSVTLATRDRLPLLREAIDSVLGQSYQRFELIIMNDSDKEETGEYLATIDDPRVRVVRTPERRGAGAAYNIGLKAAGGDIIAFLDDDNLMHREWLRSIVWTFSHYLEVNALYGARINEDPGAQRGVRSGMLPLLEFARYDRSRHERANYIDRNTIAFRSEFSGIGYDESLNAAFDWDQSLRLFTQAPPLALPAVACYYRTVLPDRVSDIPQQSESVRRVRSRTHTTRPLRVHVHSAMYPVISETYIGEDIDALEGSGAVVTASSVHEAVSKAESAPPCRLDFEEAIAEANPDVVLMHWATHAEGQIPLMERLGMPFVCRVHSFDVDRELAGRLLEHPLCVALYAHPHHLPLLPQGVKPLLPTVGPRTLIPASPVDRSLVLSVSAGLPKKEFPFLIDAFAQLPDIEREIILARSNGIEDLPEEVESLAAGRDPTITVRVSVQRPVVLAQIARASVLVYSLNDDSVMGYPMSIIEAMLCGTIVIAPDRAEAREIVGEHLRTYRNADDIIRHVHEVARGGSDIATAREALRERAQRHRDPVEMHRLHDSIRDDLTQWRVAQV